MTELKPLPVENIEVVQRASTNLTVAWDKPSNFDVYPLQYVIRYTNLDNPQDNGTTVSILHSFWICCYASMCIGIIFLGFIPFTRPNHGIHGLRYMWPIYKIIPPPSPWKIEIFVSNESSYIFLITLMTLEPNCVSFRCYV